MIHRHISVSFVFAMAFTEVNVLEKCPTAPRNYFIQYLLFLLVLSPIRSPYP